MNKLDKLLLWNEQSAPYTEECQGQAQPSLKAYPVEGSRGAVIICPGGAYIGKADHEGGPIAEKINEAGVSAFVLDYRVKPCPYLAPLGDAKRAIRLVRSMGYERVGILGFSAGGHLACSAATLYDGGDPQAEDPLERLSSRPDALIACYPVASFVTYRHQGTLESLLGERRGDLSLLRRFSAEEQVTSDTPPAFIWHTAADEGVPVENSLNLAAALSRHGVPFELHVYPEGRHGLGLAEEYEDVRTWSDHMNTWLVKSGFGKA